MIKCKQCNGEIAVTGPRAKGTKNERYEIDCAGCGLGAIVTLEEIIKEVVVQYAQDEYGVSDDS